VITLERWNWLLNTCFHWLDPESHGSPAGHCHLGPVRFSVLGGQLLALRARIWGFASSCAFVDSTGAYSSCHFTFSWDNIFDSSEYSRCHILCTSFLYFQDSCGESLVIVSFLLCYWCLLCQLNFPPTPILPLLSLACIPIVAYSILFLTPLTIQSISNLSFKPQHFGLSYPTLLILSYILGTLAFKQVPTWTDILVASLLYVGKSQVVWSVWFRA